MEHGRDAARKIRKVGQRKRECSSCNAPIEETRWTSSRYCRECAKKMEDKEKKKARNHSPDQLLKNICRSKARNALKSGKILRQICEICGATQTEMHHDDYSKPLDVRWFCKRCHVKKHKYERMSLSQKSWRAEYKRMYYADLKKRSPAFYESGGGDSYQIPIPSEKNTNGLTKIIMKFLKLKGHYANRINTQGQARMGRKIVYYEAFTNKPVYAEGITYTKGTTRRGTPDIDAIIYGKTVKIEVKVGRDSMRDEQWDEKCAIESAGGFYFIARSMQPFYEWYIETFEK